MTVWNDLLIFSEYVPLGTFWSLDWDISRVKDAVKKDKISESQFKEITGQEYDA